MACAAFCPVQSLLPGCGPIAIRSAIRRRNHRTPLPRPSWRATPMPPRCCHEACSSTSTAAKATRWCSAGMSPPPCGRNACSKEDYVVQRAVSSPAVQDVEVDDLNQRVRWCRAEVRVRRAFANWRAVRRLLHAARRADHLGARDVRGDASGPRLIRGRTSALNPYQRWRWPRSTRK